MELDDLPPKVRERVDRLLTRKPALRPSVEQLLAQRRRSSAGNQAFIDKSLLELTSNRNRNLIGLTVLGVLGVGGGMYYLNERQWAEVNQIVAQGTPTTAQVERMTDGDCLIGSKTATCLELTVKLYPQGKPPYSARFTQLIPKVSLARVQPGAWLTLSVDRADPSRVALDAETLSVAPPPPVADSATP
ncbi:MAG: hypothetical protein OZ921_20775 [Sorangiineae bacterium]|nr:hypothetical protein [Polyangiaceae bacterium]MEB2324961.1 hypothetical protein [Sorangiineae bacterium]